MVSACVVPTMKPGGGGVMVWGCFAGDTVSDLFRIQGTRNQHGYHSIPQRYSIPSGLRLAGRIIYLSTGQCTETHLHAVRGLFDEDGE